MTTLANGVRVITEAMPHVRSVSVGIWIGSGSRRETPEQNGISHFIEHMLFKGTTSRSAEDIARAVDALGGNLDAFTAKELVCFNTKVLDQHHFQAFDVLADLVLNHRLREEDIEKEKSVILEEIKMEADSPDYLVHEIFSSNFWKDHPLGKPILGTPQSVRRFDSTMIRDFYRSVYCPANLVVTAAGHMTHEELTALVRQYFASLPPGTTLGRSQPGTHARIALRNKKSSNRSTFASSALLPAAAPGAVRLLCAQHPAWRRNELPPFKTSVKAGTRLCCFSEPTLTGIQVAFDLRRHQRRVGAAVVSSITAEFRQLKGDRVSDENFAAPGSPEGSLMLGLNPPPAACPISRARRCTRRFFTLDELVRASNRLLPKTRGSLDFSTPGR